MFIDYFPVVKLLYLNIFISYLTRLILKAYLTRQVSSMYSTFEKPVQLMIYLSSSFTPFTNFMTPSVPPSSSDGSIDLNDTPKLVHRSTKLSRLIVPFADYYPN